LLNPAFNAAHAGFSNPAYPIFKKSAVGYGEARTASLEIIHAIFQFQAR
jgi:hypothetical protein